MAHATKISELAQGLITSIVGTKGDHRKFKESTLKGLRDNSHARTNQFIVQSRFDGLVEKFTVLDREDLAVSLQSKLDELPAWDGFLPELLALFLELSDRPQDRAHVENPHDSDPHQRGLETELTWDDILENDPLEDDVIWQDIERGYHSSGDEDDGKDEQQSHRTASTTATTIEDNVESLARTHLIQIDKDVLEKFVANRSVNPTQTAEGRSIVAEIDLIRETLFMLHGQPSHHYHMIGDSGVVNLKVGIVLAATSRDVLEDTLAQLCSLGTQLNTLRRWVRSPQNISYIRTCQTLIQKLLCELDRKFSLLEQQFSAPTTETVVSIMQIAQTVQHLAAPFPLLSSLVDGVNVQSSSRSPFALLDRLYSEACLADMVGDRSSFRLLIEILLDATKTYLRDITEWITTGRASGNKHDSLIIEQHAECVLGEVWHKMYTISPSNRGSANAPVFLQDFVNEIFALGKAKMFMQLLVNDPEFEAVAAPAAPDFETILLNMQSDFSDPFDQLFRNTLESWLMSIASSAVSSLPRMLLYDRGLLQLTETLQYVFLAKDGYLFESFAETLMTRIANTRGFAWTDGFFLTELACDTLATAPKVDAGSLSVAVQLDNGDKSLNAMQALEALHVEYHVPWQAQNVTQERTPSTHAKVFTMLLQIYRAKYLLQAGFFDLRSCTISNSSSNPAHARLLRLRQRLLTLVGILGAHIASVASVLGADLHTELKQSSSLDGMAAVYAAYNKRLGLTCMLLPKLAPIRQAITGLLVICEGFEPIWSSSISSHKSSDGGKRVDMAHTAAAGLEAEYMKGMSFLTAGVRGISRSGGGEPLLEALADRLEWT